MNANRAGIDILTGTNNQFNTFTNNLFPRTQAATIGFIGTGENGGGWYSNVNGRQINSISTNTNIIGSATGAGDIGSTVRVLGTLSTQNQVASTITTNLLSTNILLTRSITGTAGLFVNAPGGSINIGANIVPLQNINYNLGSVTATGFAFAQVNGISTNTNIIGSVTGADDIGSTVRILGTLSTQNQVASTITTNLLSTSVLTANFLRGSGTFGNLVYTTTLLPDTSNASIGNAVINTYASIWGTNLFTETITPRFGNNPVSTVRILGNLSTGIINVSTINSRDLNISTIIVSTINARTLNASTIFGSTLNTLFINTSSIEGNGSNLFNLNAISSLSLQSTVVGLGTFGYLSTNIVPSTIVGLGTFGYLSSFNSFVSLTASDYVCGGYLASDQTILINTDTNITFSDDFDPQNWYNTGTTRFQPTIGGYYEVSLQVWWAAGSVTNNQYNIQILKNNTTVAITQSQITTSIGLTQNITKIIYMNGSTDFLRFTVFNGNSVSVNIQSGGTTGGTFFSAALLTNGSSGEPLISTVSGLGTTGYISSLSLQSTVRGLGTTGYISSLSLQSTVRGLGTFGYLSTNIVPSTLVGLGSFGYISSLSLQSTIVGLGTFDYISSSQLISTMSNWSLYDAKSSINMRSNNIDYTNEIILMGGGNNFLGLTNFYYTNRLYYNKYDATHTFVDSRPVAQDWSYYQAENDVDIASYNINNVNTTTTENIASLGGTITVNNSHFIPSVDDSYDLGSATNRWRELYVAGTSIHLGNSLVLSEDIDGKLSTNAMIISSINVENLSTGTLTADTVYSLSTITSTITTNIIFVKGTENTAIVFYKPSDQEIPAGIIQGSDDFGFRVTGYEDTLIQATRNLGVIAGSNLSLNSSCNTVIGATDKIIVSAPETEILNNAIINSINVSSINKKLYPYTSTLNIPFSSFSITGNQAGTPIVLYSNVEFLNEGFHRISQKCILSKNSGGTSQDIHANIFYTVGTFPSTPTITEGYSALGYVNTIGRSTFTTLMTEFYVSTPTTRNICYYDSVANSYTARLYMGTLFDTYTPSFGLNRELIPNIL
jgi:hypothetical protein